jgi:hypothetical protein
VSLDTPRPIIAEIYYAANCPTCQGYDYNRLIWFNNLRAVCEHIVRGCENNEKIGNLWNPETHESISDIKIKYTFARHCVGEVLIEADDVKIRVIRDPYKEHKYKMVIENAF